MNGRPSSVGRTEPIHYRCGRVVAFQITLPLGTSLRVAVARRDFVITVGTIHSFGVSSVLLLVCLFSTNDTSRIKNGTTVQTWRLASCQTYGLEVHNGLPLPRVDGSSKLERRATQAILTTKGSWRFMCIVGSCVHVVEDRGEDWIDVQSFHRNE